MDSGRKGSGRSSKKASVISAIEMCQEIGLPVSETIKKVARKYKLEEK